MSYYTYLNSFIQAYQHCSLRKAAQALSMSQPAISKHIVNLEQKLNVPLFIREPGHQIKPTVAADRLAKRIKFAIQDLDQVIQTDNPISSSIVLGADREILNVILSPELLDILNTHCIRLSVSSPAAKERYKLVAKGMLDFTVSPMQETHKDVENQQFLMKKYILVAKPSLLKENEFQEKELKNLDKLNWLYYSGLSYDYMKGYYKAVHEYELAYHSTITLSDEYLLLEMVLQGAGVSLLPYYLCKPYLDKGELYWMHPEKSDYLEHKLFLVWQSKLLTEPKAKIIYDYLMTLEHG